MDPEHIANNSNNNNRGPILALAVLFGSGVLMHIVLSIVRPINFKDGVAPPRPEVPASPGLIKLSREETRRSYIAWPATLLCLASISTLIWNFVAAIHQQYDTWIHFGIATVAIFVIFTPLHDSVHLAVSKNKFINHAIGHISGLPLLMGFDLFRFIHLSHHKYNCDENFDPDLWAGQGPTLLLPLRWMTVFHYYLHYVFSFYRFEATLKQDDNDDKNQTNTHLTGLSRRSLYVGMPVFVSTVAFSFFLGANFGWVVWMAWVGPALTAAFFLMYAFDYLPHRPHVVTDRENPYMATSVIQGVLFGTIAELTIPLLYQNYHSIHHLFPFIPFHRYSTIYYNHKEELMKNGTQIRPIVYWNLPEGANPLAGTNKMD